MPAPPLNLLGDHELDETLLVVALRDDVHQDVVLLELPVRLVVLVFKDGATSVPRDGALDVLVLRGLLVLEKGIEIFPHFRGLINSELLYRRRSLPIYGQNNKIFYSFDS